jgi:hypothetical protein
LGSPTGKRNCVTWERRRLCLKQRCGTNASALCPAAGSRPKTSRLKKKPFKRRYSCDTARSYNMQPCCSVGHGTRGDTDRPIHTHASIFAAQVSRLVSAHAEASGRADVAEAAAQVCLPQLHRYWAHPLPHLPGARLTSATSAPGPSASSQTRAWARPSHICTETGRRHSRCNWRTFTSVRRCSTRERLSWMGACRKRARVCRAQESVGRSPVEH